MKSLLQVVRLTLKEYIAYRLNFFLEILGGALYMGIIVALWYSIYSGQHATVISGFRLPEMITYLIGAGLLSSYISLTAQGDEINDDINRGNLSHFLALPLSVPLYWFVRDACRRFITIGIGLVQFFVIVLLFRHYLVGPASSDALGFTILFTFLAGMFHFLLFTLFSFFAFWLDQTWGFRFVIRVVMNVTTGALIPLSFFSSTARAIFLFLPFRFFAFTPLQLYLGNITGGQVYHELVSELIWIVVVGVLVAVQWRRGVRAYIAYGA